jgi:hypothetical protein
LRTTRVLPVLVIAVAFVAACGSGTVADGDATVVDDTAVEDAPQVTAPEAAAAAPVTGTQTALEQPAIWPSADVVFATPEQAAEDFVAQVLGVEPVLGDFQQGDARSGEIVLLSPGEGEGATPTERGVLLLRQLGPADGWFVIGVANDAATITAPQTGATVTAGQVTVEGAARGFEGTVVVSAFLAGDAGAVLDSVITQGGPFETPEPFSVTLDLSDAAAGDIVALLVRGDVGLETDPGDVGAIPIVIGPGLPVG